MRCRRTGEKRPAGFETEQSATVFPQGGITVWMNLTEFQKTLLRLLETPEPGCPVFAEAGGSGIQLERTGEEWHVRLKEPAMIGRAAMLLEQNRDRPDGWCCRETPAYGRFGVMLDCSRNAVPKTENIRRLLRILCRMGYNTVQLYLEDVYEADGYPYFGHGRGRYTKQELKELDSFAAALGIELVPAIQTLAHLGQSLKWKAMASLVDTGDILLADSSEVQAFLGAMFDTMRECFSTNRINIGMDEAHMLGLGRHLDLHGYENRTELMLRHFRMVHDLANAHGFRPMMWSDMFFRLASGGEYYAPECALDESIAKTIPADTSLIYWDYYSLDEQIYDRMLARHKCLSENVVFAGGAWKWSGFAPSNYFSMQLADRAHHACVRQGIGEVLITMWGDNGAECPAEAVLPALYHWAQLCWQEDETGEERARGFRAACGGVWEDFLLPDELAFTPDNPAPGRMAVNATKTLLYEDILTPLFSPALDLAAYESHLREVSAKLAGAAERSEAWKGLFLLYGTLADALARKASVQRALHPAWKKRDRETLAALCAAELPALAEDVRRFADAFRAYWLSNNKAPGLDIFDLRIGGQLERIASARRRLESWLNGEFDTVEELDIPWLPFDPSQTKEGYADIPAPFWHRIVSAADISLI